MGKRLAVIFPGIGYHCDKPILYYSRKLAKEQEYKEIISLEYSYTEKNIRGNEKRMKEVFDVLYQQAEKLLETIDFSKYENVLFISKSVGTVISSAYAQKHKIRCKQILYTPLEQTYKFEHPDAIAFLGTSDLWSNTANVKMLSNEQNVPIYMYKKADHSLETGDIIKMKHWKIPFAVQDGIYYNRKKHFYILPINRYRTDLGGMIVWIGFAIKKIQNNHRNLLLL